MAILKIRDEDGNVYEIPALKGTPGSQGPQGIPGPQGESGAAGYTPVKGTDYWTAEDQKTIQDASNAYIAGELAKRSQIKPEFAQTVEECTDPTKLYVLPDGDIYAYLYSFTEIPIITYESSASGYWAANETVPTGEHREHETAKGKRTVGLIPVTPGDQFSYKGKSASFVTGVAWLNADKQLLSEELYDAKTEPVVVTAPVNAAYVWFGSFDYTSKVENVVLDVQWISCQASNKQYRWASTGHTFVSSDYEDRIVALEQDISALKEGTSSGGMADSLSGKKIVYDGDSICRGYYANGGYPALIAQATGCTYSNMAEGGGRLCSYADAHSVVGNLQNLPKDGDLYCFEGGINDFWANTPLGVVDMGDYDSVPDASTIAGALETIFRYALENFVGKAICFVIPHKIQRTAFSGNANGNTFSDYRATMIAVCIKYSIPYYDAFEQSGLNGWNATQNAAYLTGNGEGVGDGIHPNAEGYKRYYVPQLIDLFRKSLPI